MAKKCIGVREDSGEPCPRPASGDSDFCWVHKQQERDMKILYLQDDVYHCPDDGQKLLYVPRRKEHACRMCQGVLQSAKAMDQVVLESILALPEVIEEGLAVECPTCSTDSDLSDGEVPLSNFAAEWQLTVGGKYTFSTYYGVSKIGHCKVCGCTWFPGPPEFDAAGKKIRKLRRFEWTRRLALGGRGGFLGFGEGDRIFSKRWQSSLREERKSVEAMRCQHVDSNGKRCNKSKADEQKWKSKKTSDYCYRHRPN